MSCAVTAPINVDSVIQSFGAGEGRCVFGAGVSVGVGAFGRVDRGAPCAVWIIYFKIPQS